MSIKYGSVHEMERAMKKLLKENQQLKNNTPTDVNGMVEQEDRLKAIGKEIKEIQDTARSMKNQRDSDRIAKVEAAIKIRDESVDKLLELSVTFVEKSEALVELGELFSEIQDLARKISGNDNLISNAPRELGLSAVPLHCKSISVQDVNERLSNQMVKVFGAIPLCDISLYREASINSFDLADETKQIIEQVNDRKAAIEAAITEEIAA